MIQSDISCSFKDFVLSGKLQLLRITPFSRTFPLLLQKKKEEKGEKKEEEEGKRERKKEEEKEKKNQRHIIVKWKPLR